MINHLSEKQIRRWVKTLIWLRHNGRRWKTAESGGLYSVAFNQQEEKDWLSNIPSEYQAIVKSTAIEEIKRLKLLQKRTGRQFGYLLINNEVAV